MRIQQFNSLYAHPATKQLLRKAMLTSESGVAAGTIPQHLEEIITNTVVRLVPELAVPVLRFDNQKFHEFNRLTGIPSAGSAMGEASTTPIRRSAYTPDSIQLKIMKRKGAVTGFLKDASAQYLAQPASEMENHIQSFGFDLRTYYLFGNKGADSYTFDGLDVNIATNRTNLSSSQVPTDLSLLDAMVDANSRRQGQMHRKVWLMSPELLSKFSSLWTVVRDTRAASRGTSDFEVVGGYRLEAYRGIPILETTGTRPVVDMGTVVLSTAGTGGTIAADTYYIRIAPVTWDGEQVSSAASNSVTTSGSTSTITATFTAVDSALFYKVYCDTVDGSETLVKVVSAFTYDSDGTPTAEITSITLTTDPTVADTDSVPTHMQDDVPLERDPGFNQPMEYLILWDLDEFQGLGKVAYTNTNGSRFRGLITPMEVYNTDDNFPFLLKSYCAQIPAYEATSFIARGLRTA